MEVQVQFEKERQVFEYKVVCDMAELKKPDLNVFLLFAIAVGVVFVAFHTPEL